MNKNGLFKSWEEACKNENINAIKFHIESGYDINSLKQGFNALHYAVFHGKKKLFNYLISRPDLDINVYNKSYKTVLMILCNVHKDNIRYGMLNNIRYWMLKKILKHKKLDVNKYDYAGNTALVLAAAADSYDVVELLLLHPNIDVTVIKFSLTYDCNFIGLMNKTDILEKYNLQKGIMNNNRHDIILYFKDWGIVNNRIKEEFPHIFSGVELNLL